MALRLKRSIINEHKNVIYHGFIKEIYLILKLPPDLQLIIIDYLTVRIYKYVKYIVRCALYKLSPNIYGDSKIFKTIHTSMINKFLREFNGKKYEHIHNFIEHPKHIHNFIEHPKQIIKPLCQHSSIFFDESNDIHQKFESLIKMPKTLYLTRKSRLKLREKNNKSSIKISRDKFCKKKLYNRVKKLPTKFNGTEYDAEYMSIHDFIYDGHNYNLDDLNKYIEEYDDDDDLDKYTEYYYDYDY